MKNGLTDYESCQSFFLFLLALYVKERTNSVQEALFA